MTQFKDWIGIIVVFILFLVAVVMYGGLIIGLFKNRLLIGPKLAYLVTFTSVNAYVSRNFAYAGGEVGIFDVVVGIIVAAIIFVIAYAFVPRTHLENSYRESSESSLEEANKVSQLALKEGREIQAIVVAVILEIAFNAYNITVHL